MATKMDIADLDLTEDTGAGTQQVAVLEEPGTISLARARVPEPGPGEIRVRIRYVGICGSDLESYRGVRSPEFLSTPARLGHEVSGVIDALGEGVRGLRLGQRVSCRYVWGAFAEYIVCKPFHVRTVSEHLADEDISPLEVVPGILHAVDLAKITPHSDVLIMGQGVSGLVMTQCIAQASPRRLAVTDLNSHKLALARSYGATHTYQMEHERASTMDAVRADFPDGFEVVIPCLLAGEGMIDAVDAAAMSGRIVMYGCIGTCREPFDFLKVHRKRLDIHATEPRSDAAMRHYWDRGVAMVEQGLLNVAEMITHTFPLSRIAEAFELRNDQRAEAVHILIDCQGDA